MDPSTGVTQQFGGNFQFLFTGSPRERRGSFRLMSRNGQKFHRQWMVPLSLVSGATVDDGSFVPTQEVATLLFLYATVLLAYCRATQSGIANLAFNASAVFVASDIAELRGDVGSAIHFFRSGSIHEPARTLELLLAISQDEIRVAATVLQRGPRPLVRS